MRRARRTFGKLADLFKCQSAPDVRDDRLAKVGGKRLKNLFDGFGVDLERRIGSRIFFEPAAFDRTRGRFVASSATGRGRGVDRSVAHGAEKPRGAIAGTFVKAYELDERLLNDVLGSVAPLTRVKFERGGVAIDQRCERLRVHTTVDLLTLVDERLLGSRLRRHDDDNGRPAPSQKNDERAIFHGDFYRAIIPSVIELGSAFDDSDSMHLAPGCLNHAPQSRA